MNKKEEVEETKGEVPEVKEEINAIIDENKTFKELGVKNFVTKP